MGPLTISRIETRGLHFVGTVAGLALQVAKGGSRSWVLRASVARKRRDIGLGSYPDVTLADAQRRAREFREDIVELEREVGEREAGGW